MNKTKSNQKEEKRNFDITLAFMPQGLETEIESMKKNGDIENYQMISSKSAIRIRYSSTEETNNLIIQFINKSQPTDAQKHSLIYN